MERESHGSAGGDGWVGAVVREGLPEEVRFKGRSEGRRAQAMGISGGGKPRERWAPQAVRRPVWLEQRDSRQRMAAEPLLWVN